MHPLKGSQDPAPRLQYCFLTAPSLSLYPLPSMISNYLNLPFGTQGRRHRKPFVPRNPTGFCSVSRLGGLVGSIKQEVTREGPAPDGGVLHQTVPGEPPGTGRMLSHGMWAVAMEIQW